MDLFAKLHQARFENPERQALKINLYHDYEAEALAEALIGDTELKSCVNVECVMVADSYLMTHMGRSTTQLESSVEKTWFMHFMAGLVKEVQQVMDRKFAPADKPFLMADMPDGSIENRDTAIANAELMMANGADAIKMEMVSEAEYDILENLSKNGIPVFAHIGYAPQKGENKRHAKSLNEAMAFMELPKKIRNAGAVGMILERVNETVNQVLCANADSNLLIYSIFSGKAVSGGQSLNVWDSVFFPRFDAAYFPDTAKYNSTEYPEVYTKEVIQDHMQRLMRATAIQKYPLSPPTNLSQDEIKVLVKKGKQLWVSDN